MSKQRQFMTDDFAETVLTFGNAGRPYRPSNGTEGDYFVRSWCRDCKHSEGCKILLGSMRFYQTDPRYPKELVYGEDGHPQCNGHEPCQS